MKKTIVQLADVQSFLKEKYGISEVDISRINSGEFSDAYEVTLPNGVYILRINSESDMGFRKEEIVHKTLPLIPTPEIVEIGDFYQRGYFALSGKVEGVQMVNLAPKENRDLLLDLFTVMNKIHTSLPPTSQVWKHKQWSSILDEYTTKDVDKVSGVFFDRKLYKQLLSVFQTIKSDIAEYSYFIHGDFGRTNIFGHGRKITGIIDWSESMVGDFLWDLAWIAFWPKDIDFVGSYYKFNKDNKNLDMNNYQKRLMTYTLVIGINTMIFAGLRNEEETYLEAVARVRHLV